MNRDPIEEIVINDIDFRLQQSVRLNYLAQMADSAGFSTFASKIRTSGNNYADETHNFHALYDINLYMLTKNDHSSCFVGRSWLVLSYRKAFGV